jgi:hypothetical protein
MTESDEFVRWLRSIDANARVLAVSARDLGNEALRTRRLTARATPKICH